MRELFLDIETSGVDPERHSIISIGMVVSLNGLVDYQSFYREVKYDELIISPSSMEINKLDLTDQTGRNPIMQVDEEAVSFIKKYYPVNKIPVPIGLSIGFFDMQFIFRQMPKLFERLGRKSVDLNSLLYILAEKHSKDFKGLKIKFSEKAHQMVQNLALGVEPHNALYDAVFNMCLYFLIKEDLLGIKFET